MATPPPSQFAALLRRSKFASFDPLIGQVYTSFDGHAARGNFGLKRPLALRTRNASITVNAVDRDFRTDWNRAEKESRWIRMWDEMNVAPTPLVGGGKWKQKAGVAMTDKEIPWVIDSEFAALVRAEQSDDVFNSLHRDDLMENIEGMTNQQFERYLTTLRGLRPHFRAFLARRHRARATEDAPLFRQSFNIGDEFRTFLKERARQMMQSGVLGPQPHRFAGLSYAHPSTLQSYATSKPVPGRVNGVDVRTGHRVSVAGTVVKVLRGDRRSSMGDTMTLSCRLAKATLISAPDVVGKTKEGLDGAKLEMSAFEFDGKESGRNFAGLKVGSREYVGRRSSLEVVPVVSMTHIPPRSRAAPSTKADGKVLLETLEALASSS